MVNTSRIPLHVKYANVNNAYIRPAVRNGLNQGGHTFFGHDLLKTTTSPLRIDFHRKIALLLNNYNY